MDIHPNISSFQMHKNICDQIFEQAFSLDYLLADYLPDIFKILTCDITPAILSYTVSDGRILADLSVEMRVLYLVEPKDESQQKVAVITQKQTMQKQMDVSGVDDSCTVMMSVRPDSVRCRVVNPRRIDLKGSVMLKLNVESAQPANYITQSGQEQNSLQQNTAQCRCLSGKKVMTKEVTVTEETSLPYGTAPMQQILLYRCIPMINEVKSMGDKATCKGELKVHVLYQAAPDESGEEIQTLDFTVPVDAVVDCDGISDVGLDACMELISCELSLEDAQQNESVSGQYQLRIILTAAQNQDITYVSDLYSTQYPVQKQTQIYPLLSLEEFIRQRGICKNTIMLSEGQMAHVVDLTGDVKGCSLQKNEAGEPILAVSLHLCLLAEDAQGMLFCVEKTIPCELSLQVPSAQTNAVSGEAYIVPRVTIVSQSYNITESGELEVRTEFEICGAFCRSNPVEMVSGVTADENSPYPKSSAALRLYYAKAGEDIWEIAKAFRTDYAAAVTENDLSGEKLTEDRMLVIPMP